MKKFFVTVLCIAVAAIAGYGIKYALTPLNTQKIEYVTHETSVSGEGYIILDEWLMTARNAGTFYHSVAEGERVSRDSVIGELFYGEVSDETLQELTVADSRIKKASADGNDIDAVDLDPTTVESNIYRRENDIIEAASENDIEAVAKYKSDINSLRSNNKLSPDGELAELEERKNRILSSVGVSKEEIVAKISGVLSMYTDGYEELLNISDIGSYTVAYLDSLPKDSQMRKIDSRVDVGGPVCKIVNNHIFYVMMAIPTEQIQGRKYGDSVKLRFKNMAGEMKNGIIYSISEDQGGRALVVVACSDYLENAFSYRIADVDLIFESYTGYKIPIQAIRTEENSRQKVIGIKGNVRRDCYFDLVYTYTDGGYAIVRPSDDSAYKLSDMDSILVGER